MALFPKLKVIKIIEKKVIKGLILRSVSLFSHQILEGDGCKYRLPKILSLEGDISRTGFGRAP